MDPQLLARLWLGQAAAAPAAGADGGAPPHYHHPALTTPYDATDDHTETDESDAVDSGDPDEGAAGCLAFQRRAASHRRETAAGGPAALATLAPLPPGDLLPRHPEEEVRPAAHQATRPVPLARPAAPAAAAAPAESSSVQAAPVRLASAGPPPAPTLSLADAAALEDASAVVPFTVVAGFDPSIRAEAHYVGPPGRRRAMAFTYDGMVFTGVAPLGQAMVGTWRTEQDVLDGDYPPGMSRWAVRTALWLLVRCGGTVMSLAAAKDANLLASGGRFLRDAPAMDTAAATTAGVEGPAGNNAAAAASAAAIATATGAAGTPAAPAAAGAVVPAAQHPAIELPAAVGVRPFTTREDVRASLVHVVMPHEPSCGSAADGAVAIRHRRRKLPEANAQAGKVLARAGTVRFVFEFRGKTFLSAKALAADMLEACRAPPTPSATTPPQTTSNTDAPATVEVASPATVAEGAPASVAQLTATSSQEGTSSARGGVVNGVRRLVLIDTGLKLGDAVLQRRFR